MTNKLIQVSGCHDKACGYLYLLKDYYPCEAYCHHPDNFKCWVTENYLNKTIHPDCPLDDVVDATISLMPLVPQTFGEAMSLYPWIKCESHEWDNRTTLENTIWLLEKQQIRQDAIKPIREVELKYRDTMSTMNGLTYKSPEEISNILLEITQDLWQAIKLTIKQADGEG